MAATYAGKLITAVHDGSLCFLTCEQGVDDFLIENNLTIAAAIDGEYLTYESIDQDVKTLVLDDGSSITSEDCIDVSSIPSTATFIIVNEPAFYWNKYKVGWAEVIGQTYLAATINGKLIIDRSNSEVGITFVNVQNNIESYISLNENWRDYLNHGWAAGPPMSYFFNEDGSSVTDVIDVNNVPDEAKLELVNEPKFNFNTNV